MPYLEINKQILEVIETVEMPNVEGLTFEEGIYLLKKLGLSVETNQEIENESIIKEQIPKKGIKVNIGSKVVLK